MINFFLKRKAEASPIAVIVAFFVVFFWPAIFSDMCFVGGDALVYSYPMRQAAWEMIRNGDLPLWTPHILSGFPMLAMTQLGIGYPLTWGYLFLPGHIAEEKYVLAPYLLAPAFIYAYLRVINCSRPASLLGALSFTYGGMMMSGLGQNAMFTNAVMWLPLLLIAIERAWNGRFLLCLAGAGAAYAMSVLTGLGQMFVYVGLIAVGYGAFLTTFGAPSSGGISDHTAFGEPASGGGSGHSILFRLRPLIVSLAGVALGAGVAAFQIFETMLAQRLSLRQQMTYEYFSGASFAPSMIWRSFITPIHHFNNEVSAYVAPLAAVFALVAVICAMRYPVRRLRVYFWLLVAALGLLLMMGDHTPLYRLLYRIPVINQFRHPWRHAYEWTLGASMLAALGWDVAERFFRPAVNGEEVKTARRWRGDAIGALLLAGCVAAMVALMWMARAPVRTGASTFPTGLSEATHSLAKLAYTLASLVTVWWSWRKMRPVGRGAVLALIIMSACFWEQYLLASGWWFPQNKPAAHFTQVSPIARFLEARSPLEGRIYTSWSLWLKLVEVGRHEPHNLTARHGFHNAAGYEPLMPERYGLSLGGGWNYETPNFDEPGDPKILAPRWQTLDLLNVRYVIQPVVSQSWGEQDGARFASADSLFNLGAGSSIDLSGASSPVDTLSMVTAMANSVHLPQGAAVASVIIHTADGRRIERQIKAGADTAEWAHDRPDVKSVIRHSLARIFFSVPADGFSAHRYWTKFDLGDKTAVDRVELKCVAEGVTLILFKATIYDSSGAGTFLLKKRMPAHWRKVYDNEDAQIYENPQALPRAWLVPRAEILSADESRRRIRGESEYPFNPRETALLELDGKSRPDLPQGDFQAPPEARIVNYEPSRLAIETGADKRAVLVVSETNYPGWEATIDGQPATIFAANYLLRGVIVPEGRHRVEMRYTAPAARRGAIISALTLLALAGAAIFSRSVKL